MGGLTYPVNKNVVKSLELFYHRGHNQVANKSEDGANEEQCKYNRNRPKAYMQSVFYEFYDRIEQISQQPGHEEGDENIAQIVQRAKHGHDKQDDSRPTYECTECNFFLHEIIRFQTGSSNGHYVRLRLWLSGSIRGTTVHTPSSHRASPASRFSPAGGLHKPGLRTLRRWRAPS